MTAKLAVVIVLVACQQDGPLERVATPTIPASSVPGPRRPPPPPPPPHAPQPVPPPPPVHAFLDAHANGSGGWTASYRWPAKSRHELAAADAAELVRRLGMDESYTDADPGCASDPVAYTIERDGARFAFDENCGHMRIGSDGEAAHFSSEMLEFLRRLRGNVF